MLHFKDFYDAVHEYHVPPLKAKDSFVVEFLREMLTNDEVSNDEVRQQLVRDALNNRSKFYHILNGRGSMPSPYDEYLWEISEKTFRLYVQKHYESRMTDVIESLSLLDAFCNVTLDERNLISELYRQLWSFFKAPKGTAQQPLFLNTLNSTQKSIIERDVERDRIADRLRNWRIDSSPIYICGEDGIGKTTFVKSLPRRFPTYDFYYIQYDSFSLLTTILQLTEESERMEKLETESERHEAFAKRIRKLRASRRAVLIIDDMDILLDDHNIEVEQTLQLMQGVKLIIVSKDQIAETENVIALSALSSDSLIAIFRSIVNNECRMCKNADDSKLLTAIIDEDLGRNTFGVVLAAKTMREDDELSLSQLHFNLTNIETTAYQWPNLPVGVGYQPLLKQLRALVSPQRIPYQMLELVQLVLVTPRWGININDLQKAVALPSMKPRDLRELSRAGWLIIDSEKLSIRPTIRMILQSDERTKPRWDNRYIKQYAASICRWATEQQDENALHIPSLTHKDYIDSIERMIAIFDRSCDIAQRILFRRALANMYCYVGAIGKRHDYNLECIDLLRELNSAEYYHTRQLSFISVDDPNNSLKDVWQHVLLAHKELADHYAMEGDYRQARRYNLLALQYEKHIEPTPQFALEIAERLSEIGKMEFDVFRARSTAMDFYVAAKSRFLGHLTFEEAIGMYPAFCYLAQKFDSSKLSGITIPLFEEQSLMYYLHRCEIYLLMEDPTSALKACEMAERYKEIWPQSSHLLFTFYVNKGCAHAALDNNEDASRCFEQALRYGDRHEAWFNWSMSEFKLGHPQAKEYVQKALYRSSIEQIANSGWYEQDSEITRLLLTIILYEMPHTTQSQDFAPSGIKLLRAYEEVFSDCPYIRDAFIISDSIEFFSLLQNQNDTNSIYFRQKIESIAEYYGDELEVIYSDNAIEAYPTPSYRHMMKMEAIDARIKLQEQFIRLADDD